MVEVKPEINCRYLHFSLTAPDGCLVSPGVRLLTSETIQGIVSFPQHGAVAGAAYWQL